MMLLPSDCRAAISIPANGRCSLYFGDMSTDDAMKLLHLFVECFRAERAATLLPDVEGVP